MVKLLSGKKLSKEQELPNFANYEPEQSEGPGIVGRLGLATVKGFEAPGHALDALLQLIGEPKLQQGSLSEDIRQKLGYQPEQVLPQSIPESYAHRFLGQAPSAVAFGPLESLKGLALGSGAATGLEAAGAPEWAQDIAQIGTQLGHGRISGQVKPLTLGGRQKEAYGVVNKLVPEGAKSKSSAVVDGINKARQALSTESNEKITSKINHAISTIENNLEQFQGKSGSYLDPKKALDLRRKLYRNVKNLPHDAKEYSKILTDSLNNFFADYSAQNPKFYEALNKADKYTQLKHMNSYLADALGEGSSLLVKGIPGASQISKKLVQNVVGNTIGEGEKFIRRIGTSPLAREHYFDAFKAVTNNPPLAIKKLSELDEMLAAEDAGIKLLEEKPSSKVKLLSGKKIA